MNSGISDKSFTQQWLQSLTLVAKEPVAQSIKPLLETINELGRIHADSDRMTSAKKLWEFASQHALQGVLEWMPIQEPAWVFDADDVFTYSRSGRTTIDSLESFCQAVGLTPAEYALTAEVNNRDWSSRLRQEAVRLQQALNTAAVPAGLTLHLGCKAAWDGKSWAVRFDQAEWMVVRYEEAFSVTRPDFSAIEESLQWAIAQGNESMLPKTAAKIAFDGEVQPWMSCVPRMQAFHKRVVVDDARHFSPWFRRAWCCVWTVIYREQNVLRGQANIDHVRQELAACIKDVPQLTVWLFIFAKLVCECQLGRGLGISGDYLA